jgi:hypothetical protein
MVALVLKMVPFPAGAECLVVIPKGCHDYKRHMVMNANPEGMA